MKTTTLVPALFLALSTPALTAPITLQSTWEGYSIDGSKDWGLGVLTFTYDDQTPDYNPDPMYGRYYRPLLALSFVFDNHRFTLDAWEPNEIAVNAEGYTDFALSATVKDPGNALYDLGLSSDTAPNFGNDALNSIIGSRASENASFMHLIGTFGRHQSLLQRTPYVIASVPEPAPLALLCAGLIGTWMVRRRKG